MLSRERILKLEILTPDETHTKILSATNKQFSLQNSSTGRTDMLLIIKGRGLPEIDTGNDVDVIVRNGFHRIPAQCSHENRQAAYDAGTPPLLQG